jgi:hypothetical protein
MGTLTKVSSRMDFSMERVCINGITKSSSIKVSSEMVCFMAMGLYTIKAEFTKGNLERG